MSTRRILGIVLLLVCAAMVAYGLFVQKATVYSGEDEYAGVREVRGAQLIYESVRQTIKRDPTAGRLVEGQAGLYECPT
jgi:hypothetical protein